MKKYTRIAAGLTNIIDIINYRKLIRKPASKYDPNRLLNALKRHFSVTSDVALGKTLDISSLVITKIRNLVQPVNGTLLIMMHEKTGLSFAELRKFMGDRRQKTRFHCTHLNFK